MSQLLSRGVESEPRTDRIFQAEEPEDLRRELPREARAEEKADVDNRSLRGHGIRLDRQVGPQAPLFWPMHR